jgi:hypothetical protein
VFVSSDIWTHNSPGKYDMSPPDANPLIVAAADGWFRAIQESFDTACFCCPQFNNYVILQHPNGEWSGYTHMQVNSTSALGLAVNDFVTAGTPIGTEGTVGCSTGNHLHWEVVIPTDPANAWQNSGGFLIGEAVIPVICGIGTEEPWLVDSGTYTCAPCNDDCPGTFTVDAGVGNGAEFVARADTEVITSEEEDVIFANGSVTQLRSGDHILMRPGFQAAVGAKMEVMIKGCNMQE